MNRTPVQALSGLFDSLDFFRNKKIGVYIRIIRKNIFVNPKISVSILSCRFFLFSDFDCHELLHEQV